jgi:hypothetical protein
MRVRLLRGRVVVRELGELARSATIWTPTPNQRHIRMHIGRVLCVGAGAEIGGVEQPLGFRVGDVVGFHWEHNEEAFTVLWPEDGKPACWVPHRCIDYVCEDYVSLAELGGIVVKSMLREPKILSNTSLN